MKFKNLKSKISTFSNIVTLVGWVLGAIWFVQEFAHIALENKNNIEKLEKIDDKQTVMLSQMNGRVDNIEMYLHTFINDAYKKNLEKN